MTVSAELSIFQRLFSFLQQCVQKVQLSVCAERGDLGDQYLLKHFVCDLLVNKFLLNSGKHPSKGGGLKPKHSCRKCHVHMLFFGKKKMMECVCFS